MASSLWNSAEYVPTSHREISCIVLYHNTPPVASTYTEVTPSAIFDKALVQVLPSRPFPYAQFIYCQLVVEQALHLCPPYVLSPRDCQTFLWGRCSRGCSVFRELPFISLVSHRSTLQRRSPACAYLFSSIELKSVVHGTDAVATSERT